MCNCKPTGRQTADKIWGNGRTSQATDSWPPRTKKPKPFTDAETAVLTRIIQDSVNELRRKPVLSAAQVAAIRRIVQDARKPARESYRISDTNPSRYAEKLTKLRTADPALDGKVVTIGNMRCQLVHGKMICR